MSLPISTKLVALKTEIHFRVYQGILRSFIFEDPQSRERAKEKSKEVTDEIMEKVETLFKEEKPEKEKKPEELTVTLNNHDIVSITERMHREWPNPSHGHGPSQGFLEYKFCALIKEIKGVDFFEEERKMMETEEKERIARGGKKDGENEG